MNRDDIIRMAREAHRELVTKDYPGHVGQLDPWTMRLLERFAALVAAHEREATISKIESEICHAEINNLRLAPLFGQRQGPLAVRVESLTAVVDAIRARGEA